MRPPRQSLATIVMYHIVHGGDGGAIGTLKGLTAEAFRNQLAYIQTHYTPVSIGDIAAACSNGDELPSRPIVLSFDDGYLLHHDVVAPLLLDAGIAAVFFPVASAMLDRRVLDVNKIQLILAASRIDDVVQTIERQVEQWQSAVSSTAELRSQYWKGSRWDPPEIVYVKRLLQHGLPEELRRAIIDDLFRRHVTADERALAEQLYMSPDQAKRLRDAGMTIGAHGDRHLRLSTLAGEQQALEIDGALRVLPAAGATKTGFAYSYANGDWDERAVRLLRERGCAAAVTTAPDLVMIDAGAVLTLPRIDANDLPVDVDAPANVWTLRAGGELAS